MEGLNKNNIDSKRIIITGGTEGIGNAILKELSPNNNIVICARTKEKLDNIKKDDNIEAIELDLGNISEVKSFAEKSINYLGGLNSIILNAAVTGLKESRDYVFKVNSDSQKILIDAVSPSLRESGGRIVLLTSSQAESPIRDNLSYGESKRDIENWLIDFSKKEENKNIKVIFIIPGSVDTRMHEEAINFGGDETRNRSIKIKESGKLRDPHIIGKIISKISMSGNKFNPETKEYDIPIKQNEKVLISDENMKFELNNQDSQG